MEKNAQDEELIACHQYACKGEQLDQLQFSTALERNLEGCIPNKQIYR